MALALLFLVSGFWKLLDPLATEQRMVQMLFPRQIALLVAIGVGISEAWAGVMILVPRWRKWGAAEQGRELARARQGGVDRQGGARLVGECAGVAGQGGSSDPGEVRQSEVEQAL